MKKAVILLAGLLTVLSMGFASAQFSDVPAGHWAKEAVEALASQGIILGFPDGTFRGNENLTRYQAAMIIYRLLQKIQPGQVSSMDKETLTALRNAVQELAAELASLGVRVSALEDNAATKGDVARLEKMIADLKASAPAPAAGNSAAVKDLADRVEAAAIAADTALAQVQALQGKVDAMGAQVSANSDSIKALNELSVMLNQDVLSLQDRVTALEKAGTGAPVNLAGVASKGDVQAVRDYVTAIRGDLVNVSNKVSALETNVSDLQDRVGGLEKNAFSISGGLWLKYKSVRFAGSAFDIDRLYGTAFSTGDSSNSGQVVDDADFSGNVIGQTNAGLNVTFQTGKFTGTSKGEGVNTYKDFFQFSIKGSWTAADLGANPPAASTFNLVVDEVSTTVGIADGQCLSFSFGRSVKAKFTEYLFDNDANSYGHGFVATLKPGFLGTEIKAVYGNHAPGTLYQYFYGVHMAIAPFDGFTLGGSYLMQDMLGSPFYGVDAALDLGAFNLAGEYFLDSAGVTSYYAKAGLGFGSFKLGANYRNIGNISPASTMTADAADFINGSSKNSAPFRASSNGFGVDASAELGIFSLSAYYDSYTLAAPNTDVGSWQAYGAELGLKLAGMTIKGMYKEHSNAGSDTVEGAAPGQDYKAVMGASLDHPAEGAIIPGLHFYAGYMIYPHTSTTDIEAYADYNGKFSIASVELLGRYHSNSAGPTTTIKYGAKFETDPLGIFLAPSLKAGYVARTTGAVAETYWFAGLKFNKFLCDHSVFEGAYASYTGAGLSSMLLGSKDKAFDASADYIYQSGAGGNSGTFSGYYLSWTYWDLQFAYANFGDGTNSAEAFQIKYAINF